MPENNLEEKKVSVITEKDVKKSYFRWWLSAEMSTNYERMQAISWCGSIAPILEKLYPKKEDLSKALKRHLSFFNTQAMWGGMIFGSTIALEEQKAENPSLPDEMVTGYKTGLMGPVAGLGDTIDYATIWTLLSAFLCTFAKNGSLIAPLMAAVFGLFHFMEGYIFNNMGYRFGRDSIKKVMESGLLKEAITVANIMGLFMMGALSATLVTLSTVVKSGSFYLQKTLDGTIPGVLQLVAVFLAYWAMKKKKLSPSKIVLIIIIVCVLGSVVGFF